MTLTTAGNKRKTPSISLHQTFLKVWQEHFQIHCPCPVTVTADTRCPPHLADLSLTTERFGRLWSVRESPTQLFQWWRELVCRSRYANFRLWKWKPHFRGTSTGAMLTNVESEDSRHRVTSYPVCAYITVKASRLVSCFLKLGIYLSTFLFNKR